MSESDFSAFLFFWGYPKVMKLALTLKVKGAGIVIPLNGKITACHNIRYFRNMFKLLRGRGSRFFAKGQPQMRPEAHCASTRRPVRRAEEIWLRRQAR